ncbi:hypothetical protein pp2_164 [Vibrio phage phi-pp2]|uniref:Uncharacterized protein n=1 Tax=Vibrio phage phi-pp2 TaxID=1204514 RepID=I6X2E3_9CAUD|nr:hypothetical protein pp2_164 [Vibrio phage phi-pp2]WOL24701.1 hypothetical protein [Vibrio phage PG216]
MKLPEYLSHVTVKENVIIIDSARDKALVVDYLTNIKARFHIVQKTISRCEIHVKRTS